MINDANLKHVFDVNGFMAAVKTHCSRRKWGPNDRARESGASPGQVRAIWRGAANPSLWMACLFANVCDLDLDKYRRDNAA